MGEVVYVGGSGVGEVAYACTYAVGVGGVWVFIHTYVRRF